MENLPGEIKGDPRVPSYLVREERARVGERERERERKRDTLVDTEECVCFDRVCHHDFLRKNHGFVLLYGIVHSCNQIP